MDFDKHLQAGLRRDSRTARNTPAMVSYKGLRCTEYGAKDFYPLNNPFDPLPEAASWPFPQLFVCKSKTLLCYESAIYAVTEVDGAAWATSQYDTYDIAEFTSLIGTTPKAIPSGGGAWQVMDFYDTTILFNGVCYVVFGPVALYVGEWSANLAPEIQTGCDWRDGRGVMAGFDANNTFALADWTTLISGYQSELPFIHQVLNAVNTGLGPNWVCASSIGGGDLFWLFSLELMKYGPGYPIGPNAAYYDEKLYCFELWKRNEFFIAPMPWQGKALATAELGDHCIVYGGAFNGKSGGASALVYNGTNIGVYPIEGLGRGTGLASRGCMGGDAESHIFIAETGDLWSVTPDLKADRLGYAEVLADLDLSKVVITKDPHYREFYIADDTQGFVLNRNGLSEAPHRASRVSFAQGGLVAVPFDDSDAVELITEKFTAPGNVIGEVGWVRLYGQNVAADPWQVAIDYRTKSTADWTRTSFVSVDGRGIAHIHAPGIEWRIVCKCTDRTNHTLENIEAHVTSETKLSTSKWLAAATPSAATE